MKRLIKQVLLASSLISVSFAAYADGKPCNLNAACMMPPAASYVSFKISRDLGQGYTCILAAKNNLKLSVDVSSDGDVSFPTQSMTVDKDLPAVKIKLTATFNNNGRSEIHIHRTSEDKAEGYINCSRTK